MKVSIPGFGKEQSALMFLLVGLLAYFGFTQSKQLTTSLFSILAQQLSLPFWAVILPSLIIDALLIGFIIVLIVRVRRSFSSNDTLPDALVLNKKNLIRLGRFVAIITPINFTVNLLHKFSVEDYVDQLPEAIHAALYTQLFTYLQFAQVVFNIAVFLLVFALFMILVKRMKEGPEN